MLKNKFKQIQEGDEKIKKRWIVIMSFLAMAAVAGIWAAYLNFFAGAAEPAILNSEKSGFNAENLSKEWANFKEKIGEAKSEFNKIFKK